MSPAEPVFRPDEILATLERHRVRYVIVGAFAGQLRGIPLVTLDLDITPALDPSNLDRLASALAELQATIRVDNHAAGPVRLPADGSLIARTAILTLHLPGLGDLDVIHEASAGSADTIALDYVALAPHAELRELPNGTSIQIRPKDAEHRGYMRSGGSVAKPTRRAARRRRRPPRARLR